MNTTLKQITLPTPKGDEVLDMTEFATKEEMRAEIDRLTQENEELRELLYAAL